jgi:hypothetical protein
VSLNQGSCSLFTDFQHFPMAMVPERILISTLIVADVFHIHAEFPSCIPCEYDGSRSLLYQSSPDSASRTPKHHNGRRRPEYTPDDVMNVSGLFVSNLILWRLPCYACYPSVSRNPLLSGRLAESPPIGQSRGIPSYRAVSRNPLLSGRLAESPPIGPSIH